MDDPGKYTNTQCHTLKFKNEIFAVPLEQLRTENCGQQLLREQQLTPIKRALSNGPPELEPDD